jgi:membrane-associated protease RseP (regulator of RpoE activity)
MKPILLALLTTAVIASADTQAQTTKTAQNTIVGCPTVPVVHHKRKPIVPVVATVVVDSRNSTNYVEFKKGKIYVNDSMVAVARHPGYDDYTIKINYLAPPPPPVVVFDVTPKSEKPLLGVVTCDCSNDGAMVEAVIPCGPADKAGIRRGDMITMINSSEVTSKESLREAIAAHEAGHTVTVTYSHYGRTLTTNAELGEKQAVENNDCIRNQEGCHSCYGFSSY